MAILARVSISRVASSLRPASWNARRVLHPACFPLMTSPRQNAITHGCRCAIGVRPAASSLRVCVLRCVKDLRSEVQSLAGAPCVLTVTSCVPDLHRYKTRRLRLRAGCHQGLPITSGLASQTGPMHMNKCVIVCDRGSACDQALFLCPGGVFVIKMSISGRGLV